MGGGEEEDIKGTLFVLVDNSGRDKLGTCNAPALVCAAMKVSITLWATTTTTTTTITTTSAAAAAAAAATTTTTTTTTTMTTTTYLFL